MLKKSSSTPSSYNPLLYPLDYNLNTIMKKSPLSFTAWMSIAASFLTAFAFISCSDALAGYFHSGNNMRFALYLHTK